MSRLKGVERPMKPNRNNLVIYVRNYHKTPLYEVLESVDDYPKDEDQLDVEFDIWKMQLDFLRKFGRIKFDLEEDDLPDILEKIYKEDEQLIDVRIDLTDKVKWNLPDIWTRYGKLDKFCILKPKKIEDFGDLKKWDMYMVFSGQQDNIIEYDVAEGFGQFNHIMAWYALWRKWPTQYTVWEWACNLWKRFETINMFLDYGNNGVYKEWWSWAQEEIAWLPTNMDPEMLNEEEHSCPWERKVIGNADAKTSYEPKLKRQRLSEDSDEE